MLPIKLEQIRLHRAESREALELLMRQQIENMRRSMLCLPTSSRIGLEVLLHRQEQRLAELTQDKLRKAN